jgi:putative spermidine/putrescine transport system permease protein
LLLGGQTGLINKSLLALGLIATPIPFMFTETGVIIALSHVLIPFMVLAVWTALQRLDPQVENAARSLGAAPAVALYRVVLPQVMPGVLSGAIIVFALAASAFATPAIIGGRRLKVASTLAYDEFLNTLNWPLGATVATLLLIALVAIILGANRLIERRYAQVFQ